MLFERALVACRYPLGTADSTAESRTDTNETFTRAKKAAGTLLSARYVRLPDHGEELGGDLLPAKHSVYAGWEEQPQPAPPGCGLSTSSTCIEAAINRGPNLPEGIRNHYNLS